GLAGGTLVLARASVQDLDRALRAHHRDLRARPGKVQVAAHRARVHHDVRTSVRLAEHDRDAGHGGAGVREGKLGAVADHAAPFEVLAGVEARRVYERHDRQVERVAERDEPRALLRRGDVEGARDGLRLVGDDADGVTGDAGQRGHEVWCPRGPQLEDLAAV